LCTFYSLDESDKHEAENIIHKTDFNNVRSENPRVAKVLEYYTNYRDGIITPGTELYKLKQEYNSLNKKKDNLRDK
jgi:hypothetical protein